jgi:hypothetical protein
MVLSWFAVSITLPVYTFIASANPGVVNQVYGTLVDDSSDRYIHYH